MEIWVDSAPIRRLGKRLIPFCLHCLFKMDRRLCALASTNTEGTCWADIRKLSGIVRVPTVTGNVSQQEDPAVKISVQVDASVLVCLHLSVASVGIID